MEHTFQQEIISEISKYQRIIERIELNKITTHCSLIEDDEEPETPEQIREFIKYSQISIVNIIDRINMLRNEYETVIGEVCPV
jgi:hypothetical protein